MLISASSSSTYVLYVVDAILLIYGLYSMKCASAMKQTGVPAEWLVSKEEQKRLHQPKEFCNRMAPKTLLFGAVCVIYAAYAVFERLVINVKAAQISGIFIFILIMLWFVSALQKARKEFISF